MGFSTELCQKLNDCKMAIIYGYADIGSCILDYIIDVETNIKIANYSGKVKYFATTKVNTKLARTEIKGIKIRSIFDLQEFSENTLVIVATQEQYHTEIVNTLEKLGFSDYILVKHSDYCEIREKVENHKGIINNRIGQYHLNHRMKLERLRRKVEKGNKVRVFFMTHDSTVFGAASVYREMEKNALFEPYIYVVSRRDVSYDKYLEEIKKDKSYFQANGYRVIEGYDEYGTPRDLHQLDPDIIFFDIPKYHGAGSDFYNRLENLSWEYLTCYIPYGLYVVDSFYYHYQLEAIRECWRFFIDTQSSYKRLLADCDFNAYNTVMSGYPKFDSYNDNTGCIPDKVNNDKPLVIYAPHHSLGVSNNFATFDLYGEVILEFAKNNPEINFVYKPHPLLYYQIRNLSEAGKISITEEYYKQYVNEWDLLPNGVVVDSGDYIELFKKSKCMITDCGSFIGEYLPSSKPCIYMFNPRKARQYEVYTPLAQKILDSYYIVNSKSELTSKLEDIIINNLDEKSEMRSAVLGQEFGNIGHSGKYICDYLEKELNG